MPFAKVDLEVSFLPAQYERRFLLRVKRLPTLLAALRVQGMGRPDRNMPLYQLSGPPPRLMRLAARRWARHLFRVERSWDFQWALRPSRNKDSFFFSRSRCILICSCRCRFGFWDRSRWASASEPMPVKSRANHPTTRYVPRSRITEFAR